MAQSMDVRITCTMWPMKEELHTLICRLVCSYSLSLSYQGAHHTPHILLHKHYTRHIPRIFLGYPSLWTWTTPHLKLEIAEISQDRPGKSWPVNLDYSVIEAAWGCWDIPGSSWEILACELGLLRNWSSLRLLRYPRIVLGYSGLWTWTTLYLK